MLNALNWNSSNEACAYMNNTKVGLKFPLFKFFFFALGFIHVCFTFFLTKGHQGNRCYIRLKPMISFCLVDTRAYWLK